MMTFGKHRDSFVLLVGPNPAPHLHMRPIFIGGCDRSGTTLLGSMLGAHPHHVTVPEMPFKFELLVDEHQGLDQLHANWRFRIWEVNPPPVGNGLANEPRVLVEELVSEYAKRVGKHDASTWIDHTPGNSRFAWTLSQYFRDAAFVHLVRDGRAVAASLLRLDWGPNDVARAAHYWVEQVAHGLATELQRTIKPVVRVRYEDVVATPSATLEVLCGRLGVEYCASMAKASGFVVPATSKTTHRLVGSDPDRSRAEAWRHELSRRQIEIFENIAGDMLVQLGYVPEFGARARPATTAERFEANLRHGVQTRFNKLRSRRRRHAGLRQIRAGSGT